MQIIEMPVGELIPYENNPRKNDDAVEKVALSISAFGFKVPIVMCDVPCRMTAPNLAFDEITKPVTNAQFI